VDAALWEWNDPRTQEHMRENNIFTLYIDSPGGSVHAGNHLIQYMKTVQSQNITVNCIGQNFMSMAFVIFQACDHRMVFDNSLGMQHQMSFGMRGAIEPLRKLFQMHHTVNEKIIAMEIERIGISREDYDKKIAHDWWIYGKDNVAQNTADEIIMMDCDPSLYGIVHSRKEKSGHYSFLIRRHGCPLFRDVEVSEAMFAPFYDAASYPYLDHNKDVMNFQSGF
jgi:ATP-dependent protease ClpP protease subunit